jgi:hypothetical protein
VYSQGIMGWKVKKNTIREVVFKKEIPKKTHKEEMVICLKWYAKEMETKRNYLNCTRK